MKNYEVSFEIAGPAAIFSRPDTGAGFVSYPAPTYSAVKGIFDCVARWKSAFIRPRRVEICNPIRFQRYATNYGGPLRKGSQMTKGDSYQLFATILIDVCYKVYGVVEEATPAPNGTNHLHALQHLFERRLRQGRYYQTPCLGWSEFIPGYFGPLRNSTTACAEVNEIIESMLFRVFNRDCSGEFGPKFVQGVQIEGGVLSYVE